MNKYEIEDIIGRGASAIVYKARIKENNDIVVIKQFLKSMRELNDQEQDRIQEEISIFSGLDHPNIIKYKDSFENDGYMCIVMEYAEEGTLQQVIQETVDMNILHRDLKPTNVLVKKGGKRKYNQIEKKEDEDLESPASALLFQKKRNPYRVSYVLKLADFGVARIIQNDLAHTLIGTPRYLSPEICKNRGYNEKSDIWGIGCILYECLTLHPPFEQSNIPAVMYAITHNEYAPLEGPYSFDLKRLCISMMNDDPEKRPSIYDLLLYPYILKHITDIIYQYMLETPQEIIDTIPSFAPLSSDLLKSPISHEKSVQYIHSKQLRRTASQSNINVETSEEKEDKKLDLLLHLDSPSGQDTTTSRGYGSGSFRYRRYTPSPRPLFFMDDIYADIDIKSIKKNVQIHKSELQKKDELIQQLLKENKELKDDNSKLKEKVTKLENDVNIVNKNISTLYNTAKLELFRKETIIQKLSQQK
ncbi:hypothetical protein WA158_002214 [Blastocystis sp. Blastoise]